MRDCEQRDDQIASGMVPADAEEELARELERRDREDEKSPVVLWLERATAFSPGECAILGACVDLAHATIERDRPERLVDVDESLLRLKAKCAAGQAR
jgi:hypothetical protein